jgi:sulfide:quinone oxidoreductase
VDTKTVSCKSAGDFEYDFLVIGLGVQSQHTPLVKDKVLDICNIEDAKKIGAEVQKIAQGTVVVTVSRLPYKCPPAPFEFALLVADMLKERGVRKNVRVVLSFPKPKAVPVMSPEAMTQVLKDYEVEFWPGIQPQSIEKTENGFVVSWMAHPKFNPDGKLPVPEPTEAELILGMLPQKAPQVLLPFCDEKGYIPADSATLRTKFENVYAFGDCAALMLPTTPPKPHPKAGGFAEGQARIVYRNIFSGASWNEPAPHRQDASCKAVCAAETSLNTILLLSIDLHSVEGKPKFVAEPCDDLEFKERWWKERVDKHFN